MAFSANFGKTLRPRSLSPEFSATRDLVYSPQEIQSEIECVFPMKNRKKVNAFDKKKKKELSLREV